MKSRRYPEIRGSRRAARLERERALKELERQRKQKSRKAKRTNEAMADNNGNVARRRIFHSCPAKIRSLRALSHRVGREELISWYQQTKYCQARAVTPRASARGFLCSILDARESRKLGPITEGMRDNEPHDGGVWGRIDFILSEYGKPVEQPSECPHPDLSDFDEPKSSGVFESGEPRSEVEAQPRPPSSESTGIVKTVEGIPFTLPTLNREGAEQARITLTDLARALGYHDKSKLKQLAERHASELAEFGTSATVAEVVTREGRGSIVVQVPAYNPDQSVFLALSSDTDQGRACRTRILKAYKALLAMFEQVVQQPAASAPAFDYRELAQVVGIAVATAMAPVVEQLRYPVRRIRAAKQPNPAQQTIPQAEEKPTCRAQTSELSRIAEQDITTERKVLSAMIKRLAGVTRGMSTVEYGARMSVTYHQIEDALPKYGHDMTEDMRDAYVAGRKMNSLDYFEKQGIVRLVMRIVEELYEAKQAAKASE